MPLSGRRYQVNLSSWQVKFIRELQGLLLVLLMSIYGMAPAQALPAWPFNNQGGQRAATQPLPHAVRTSKLQEIAPPGAVQQIREELAQHHPQLSLESPSDGAVLLDENWELVLNIKDWPLANDPELGLGAHVVVQLDENPPLRISQADGPQLRIPMEGLLPGSHRLSAYAAYPWGEAVKAPEASLQWRLHEMQAMQNTQPKEDEPWLITVSPSELSNSQQLLLDWLIWNAPLQNLKEGDGRWRLRISVNGESFQIDHQDAIWIKGLPSGSGPINVQMELLDGLGEPIDPVFNNQLRIVRPRAKDQPAWMQARLTKGQIARLLGEPQIEEQEPPAEATSNDIPAEPITETPLSPSATDVDQPTKSTPDLEELPTTPTKQTEDLSNQTEPEPELEPEPAQEIELEQGNEVEISVGVENGVEVEQEIKPVPSKEVQAKQDAEQEQEIKSEPAPASPDPNSQTL